MWRQLQLLPDVTGLQWSEEEKPINGFRVMDHALSKICFNDKLYLIFTKSLAEQCWLLSIFILIAKYVIL